jgi:hypothetical protein
MWTDSNGIVLTFYAFIECQGDSVLGLAGSPDPGVAREAAPSINLKGALRVRCIKLSSPLPTAAGGMVVT